MFFKDKRIWICPKLCGCELEILADWTKDAESDGVRRFSYQHPAPFTIIDIKVANVCADHANFLTDDLPADPYNGSPGYIRLPIQNPTEAEKLYIQLYRYNGQRLRPDTCGCKIYQCFDDNTKEMTYKSHSKHTHKCQAHGNDDENHTEALAENRLKNKVLGELIKDPVLADSKLDDNGNTIYEWKKEPKWSFDEQRNLKIELPGASASKTSELDASLKGLFKTNKLSIE